MHPALKATLFKGVGGIASLFANGADGLDFDFSKTARLWQENPPTNPADGAGEVIGLAYDAHAGEGPWRTNLQAQSGNGTAWTTSAVTAVESGAAYLPGGKRVVITDPGAAGAFNRIVSPLNISVVSGTAYNITLWYEVGTSNSLRLLFDSGATTGITRVAGVWAAAGTSLGTMAIVSDDVVSGSVRKAVISWTPTGSAAGAFGVGPNATGSDETFIFHGMQVEIGSAAAYIATVAVPVTVPGNQAAQVTAGFKPAYQTAGAKFDATDDNLLTAYLAQAGANCIIAYVDVPATLAATQVIAGASGSAANRCFLAFNTSGQLCGGVGSDSTATIVGTTDWRGQTVVVGLSFDGSSVKLFAETAQEYSAAQASTPTTTIPFRIGALNNNGTAGSFCGHYIKRLLVGRRALTFAQFASIRSQLLAGG